MILTKEFVNNCRSIAILRDFLCQAIDQVDAMDEERRWRNFLEEKPEKEGDYYVMARYPDDDELHPEICYYDSCGEDFGHWEQRYAKGPESLGYFGGFDGEEWVSHNVRWWMPKPKEPEDK